MKHVIVPILYLVVLFLIVAAAVYIIPALHIGVRTTITATMARLSPAVTTPFPVLDTSRMSPLQVKVISLARTEYAKHPVSYDRNVSAYTQGNNEAWCADFLSWVMLHANAPYSNPNSDSWRIPGVFTLQAYYQSRRRYEPTGSYIPKPGDVAFIHIGTANGYSSASGHVEIVLKVSGDQMTTVGGNENGRIRIDTQRVALGVNGLVGFGAL